MSLGELQGRLARSLTGAEYYSQLTARGVEYGGAFRAIEGVWWNESEVLARLRLPEELSSGVGAYRAHPALLDAAFQAIAVYSNESHTFVSAGIRSLRVYAPPGVSGWSYVRPHFGDGEDKDTLEADVFLLDDDGEILVEARRARIQKVSPAGLSSSRPTSVPTPGQLERAGEFRKELSATEPGPRRWTLLTTEIQAQVAQVLRRDRSRIDPSRPLRTLGIDSIMSVELRDRLQSKLGITLSATLIWNYPTVKDIAAFVAGEMGIPLDPPTDGAGPQGDGASTLGGGALAREQASALEGRRGTGRPEEQAMEEPIAIVGMACRFPGGADSPGKLWQLLANGVDAVTMVPKSRWDLDAYYDADPTTPGKMPMRFGAFVDGVDQFDPYFFGISPREAAQMDPQQRLFLELAWEALEDAGESTERLAGSRTGVFIGANCNDYLQLQYMSPERIDTYTLGGGTSCIIPNRLSYLLDLRGPSVALDTACSSSLVALHLACQSLRTRESSRAIVGGMNFILAPIVSMAHSKGLPLAPDGRCKTFDARADGYVRGEGCGVVILKRLADALSDGDRIWAVIRGSGVNQDGLTNGLTAPNGRSQQLLIEQVVETARIEPSQVSLVEAHGTGTALGDPIEVEALRAVYGKPAPDGAPCAIGSVKTNVGHLEAGAGMAGLFKAVLSIVNRAIPTNLHFNKLNPHISLDGSRLFVPTSLTPWTLPDDRRCAAVSSFGAGGTNAHVIIGPAPGEGEGVQRGSPVVERAAPEAGPWLLPISARGEEALASLARAYRQMLLTDDARAESFRDICYSASLRRSHHAYRLAITAGSHEEAVDNLTAFLEGKVRPGVTAGRAQQDVPSEVVFVFPGQGSQWFGMARDLLRERSASAFRGTIERCDAAMREFVSWSLLEQLTADEPHPGLEQIDVIQPVLFAIEIALAAEWRSWGIEPSAVVGHSMGEIAAAHVAGALTLEDACRVICRRSQLLRRASGKGGMAVVGLPMDQAEAALGSHRDRVSIAVSNSPTSTVLSGDRDALESLMDMFRQKNVFCRPVKVDVASHSPQMDPLREDLLLALADLGPQRAAVPIVSTVTGEVCDGAMFDGAYWVRNLREPVLFSQAIQQLLQERGAIIIEMSPHPILLSAIEQGMQHVKKEGLALPSMRRDESAATVMRESLGALYTSGVPLDWKRLFPQGGGYVKLPSYAWQHERFWIPDVATSNKKSRNAKGQHPLLQRHIRSFQGTLERIWEADLDRAELPYLNDQKIYGMAVPTGAVFLEMASAAAETIEPGAYAVEDVVFHELLAVPATGSLTLQLVATPMGGDELQLRLFGLREGESAAGTLCCAATLRRSRAASRRASMTELKAECPAQLTAVDWNAALQCPAVTASVSFAEAIWRGDRKALAAFEVPEEERAELQSYRLHPRLLDGCLRVLLAALPDVALAKDRLTLGLESFRFHEAPRGRVWSAAVLRRPVGAEVVGDVTLWNDAGQLIAELAGVRWGGLDGIKLDRVVREELTDGFYELTWERKQAGPSALAKQADGQGAWLILADRSGVGESLARELKRRGEPSKLLFAAQPEAQRGDAQLLDWRDPVEVDRVLAELLGDRAKCRGVVHLWGLDSATEDLTSSALQPQLAESCGSVLHVAQALSRLPSSRRGRLWIATRGTQPVSAGSGPLAVAQSPLWGLGRGLALEHADLWGGLVDLPMPGSPEDAALLARELHRGDDEDFIVYREGQRYAPRVSKRPAPAAPPLSCRADATYVVVRGLSAVGLSLARWLVAQGARRVALIGPEALADRKSWPGLPQDDAARDVLSAIESIEQMGAEIVVERADPAIPEQLCVALERVASAGAILRGVLYAGSRWDSRAFADITLPELESALRTDALSAWSLHEAMGASQLDFFVLFSSLASSWGSPGLAHHAAAHQLMDALAHHRRALGLAGLSVNWSAWAGTGMVTPESEALSARMGFSLLSEEQGLEVLGRLLGDAAAQVAVAPVNWAILKPLYEAKSPRPLFALMEDGSAGSAPAASGMNGVMRRLDESPRADRYEVLFNYVRGEVSEVLRFDPMKIDPQQGLFQLGMDSIMATQLKRRLEAGIGRRFPATMVFEHPTIRALCDHLAESLLPSESPVVKIHLRQNHAVDSIAELSEDALVALLAGELSAIQDQQTR
ncbi:beta-ketoacyl synthase N-terminal-like domain-containing protein [Sorangium sp. So ce216]